MSLDAPPLGPDAETARRWAADELAKGEYQEGGSSWLDSFMRWLGELIDGIGNGIGGATGATGTIVAAAIALAVVALVVWLVVGPMRRSRARRTGEGLFDDARDAAQLEEAAREAARARDWGPATLDLYRALIAHLAQRDVVSLTAGLTAAEAAAEASRALPALAPRLQRDADAFDGIRYGHVEASEETYTHVSETLAACLHARPRLTAMEPAP
ncbi:DUF4129 domain-containing protein [Demequina subtropica]|uniref:DUF4129 domain-containing protein n=1 Tax=Demequina subtropica TaxID=1638989 RepID=UPI000784924E|nr:DUF4129 domain-containing protein [Demequina subtropica]